MSGTIKPPPKFRKWLIAGTVSICVLAGIAFGMNQKKEPETPTVYSTQIESTSNVTDNEEPVTPEPAEETADTSITVMHEKSKNGYTVAIDPGHTGCVPDVTKKAAIGPGSSEMVDMFASEYAQSGVGGVGKNTGVKESDINLGVGLALNNILTSRGYDVVLLRSDNHTATSGQERTIQANESDADILVHIYCRKDYDQDQRGGMVYLPASDNPYIGYLYDQCNDLGNAILYNYCKTTGYENAGVQYKNTELGINWSKIPVSIVMLGCLYDSVDEERLADAANWPVMAEGIANGIDEYFSDTK